MSQAEATLRTKADTSPEAMVKMLEAFAAFAVTKEQIEKRIQRRLDAIQPAQVVSLKKIYASLRDGMSTPAEWFDMGEAPPPADATGSLDAVRAAAAAKKTTKGKPAEAPTTPPAFDYAAATKKVEAATDREILALMADEFRDLPETPERAALLEASRVRDAQIAA
jgi:hypothetical protein